MRYYKFALSVLLLPHSHPTAATRYRYNFFEETGYITKNFFTFSLSNPNMSSDLP